MAPAYCPKSPAAFPSAASGLERSTALAIFSGSPASALPLRGWPNPLPIREGTKMDTVPGPEDSRSTINHALAWDSEKLGFSGRLPHPIVQGSKKCEVLDVTLSGIASESNLEAVT
ncbi:hypothetical protein EJB05_29304 [Eragrostis curvula]|uniref:Uncharacterized protein n=1 Tax=Eragrostis curvula TaxID=38414 RepID=A0A5J9UTM5_9POAL|nr:hypothetical protein EJB05_29304 [Eragrostis curvula]